MSDISTQFFDPTLMSSAIGGANQVQPTLFDQIDGFSPVGPADLPIVQNLPALQQSYTRKYTSLAPQLQGVDPAILQALQKIDMQRVNQGQAPLSKQDTAKAVAAVTGGKSATAPPQPELTNVVGNTLTDLRTMLQSIPKIPMGLWNEINALPSIAGEIAKNQKTMNPLAAVLKAPGIRMIPGSYVAGNLAQGPEGWKQMAEHPLFTTLDVLPFAKQLAGLTKTGQLAAEEAALNESVRPMNPVRAVLTRKPATLQYAAATGDLLMPNRLGMATNAFMTGNPAGRILGEMFGADSRKIASMESGAQMRLIEEMNPEAPLPANADEVIRTARAARGMSQRFGIAENRRLSLTQEMQTPSNPDWFNTLPANEQAFVTEYRTHLDTLARSAQMEGALGEFGGEWYDARSAQRMTRNQEIFNRRVAKFMPYIDQIAPLTGNSPRVQLLHDQLTAAVNGTGTFEEALKTYTGITRGRTRLGASSQVGQLAAPSGDITLARIANMRNDLRGIVAAEKQATRMTRNYIPARFQPLLGERLHDVLRTELVNRGGDPDLIARALLERNYGAIPN